MRNALVIPWFSVEPWAIRLPGGDCEVLIEPFDVTLAMALVVGFVVARAFARTHGRSVAATMDLLFFLVLFGFPVSSVLNGLFYEPEVLRYLWRHPTGVLEVRLGWSSYGGIVGGILGAWVWKWRTRESILRVGDAAAFAVPFAWTVARVGCFMSHDHPGRVSNFVLAVADYEVGAPPYPPRHDLGLYESLVFLSIAVVFLGLARKPRPDGFYFAALGVLYTPVRFCLDFLRAPVSEGGDIRYAGLTPGQYASLALFIAVLIVIRQIHGAGGPPVGTND